MKKTPEGYVLKAVMNGLAAKKIMHFRMNSGMLRNPAGRPVQFGTKGMADVLAFPKRGVWIDGELADRDFSEPTWIEVKAAKGTQSPAQKEFQERVEAEGHRYIVARSWEDVLEAL